MSWNQQPYNQAYGGHQQAPGGYQQAPGGYQQAPGGYQQAPGGYASSPYGPPPPTGQYPGAYQPGYGGPPAGVDGTLWQWFQAVDQDRSGKITADELRQALTNSNWSHFNPETCRLMIGMFDKDGSGTIDIYEFSALWKYIQDWKNCFDGDRSGTIDCNELSTAFGSFGYRLSMQFCNLCVQKFDRASTRTMKFDDFIQCCVMLKSLTDSFRSFDTNQNGVITINYEQFLEMVLNNTLSGV